MYNEGKSKFVDHLIQIGHGMRNTRRASNHESSECQNIGGGHIFQSCLRCFKKSESSPGINS